MMTTQRQCQSRRPWQRPPQIASIGIFFFRFYFFIRYVWGTVYLLIFNHPAHFLHREDFFIFILSLAISSYNLKCALRKFKKLNLMPNIFDCRICHVTGQDFWEKKKKKLRYMWGLAPNIAYFVTGCHKSELKWSCFRKSNYGQSAYHTCRCVSETPCTFLPWVLLWLYLMIWHFG